MQVEEKDFKTACESANENLSGFAIGDDTKADLRFINDNIKIARITRVQKRTRYFVTSGIAIAVSIGMIAIAPFMKDLIMTIIMIALAAIIIGVALWWSISHIANITHKAVCVIDDGKVYEYIFLKSGVFIFNTIEAEKIYENSRISERKYKYNGVYAPLFPYVDFFDTNYKSYLKSHGGMKYEPEEIYKSDKENGTLAAYIDEGKRHKYTLFLESGKPTRMDYDYSERFLYSRVNEWDQTVYIPAKMRTKIKIPKYLNVEFVQIDNFKELWAKI